VLVFILCLLLPASLAAPPAWGAEVAQRSIFEAHTGFEDWIEYTAGEGEANRLKIDVVPASSGPSGRRYRLTERGSGVVLADGDGEHGCDVSGNVALCPYPYPDWIEVELGDGDDWIDNATDVESRVSGGSGEDVLWGGSRRDSLAGNDGSNQLHGRGGDDFLADGSGAGLLDGGDGRDTLVGGAGADSFSGGRGLDEVSYLDRFSSPVFVTLDGDANDGDSSDVSGDRRENVPRTIERVEGGYGNDVLEGTAGDQWLTGGQGDDVLIGRTGADTLNGWTGFDTISYEGRTRPVAVRLDGRRNDGTDRNGDFKGDEGDRDIDIDKVIGGSGRDFLKGNRDRNWLFGGRGNDLLAGMDGTSRQDELACGPGGGDRVRSDPSDIRSGCEGRF